MSGETILSSPTKNDKLKQLKRLLEKESSPVRNYLDDESMIKDEYNRDNQDLEFLLQPAAIGSNPVNLDPNI